jgi:hypothetical protein
MQGVADVFDLRAVGSMKLLGYGNLDGVGLQFGPTTFSSSCASSFKASFRAFGDEVVLGPTSR